MLENSLPLQALGTTLPTVDPLTKLAVDLAIAYVAGNALSVAELPLLLRQIKEELARPVDRSPDAEAEPSSTQETILPALEEAGDAGRKPAIAVEESITDEFLVCLEDGGRYRTLKRHLAAQYGLTPDEYRRKWQLPADYPMVAPEYAKQRAEVAKRIGLGGKTASKKMSAPVAARSVRKQPS